MENNRTNKRLRENVLFSSLYQLLILGVPIITTPYITRTFSPQQMGEYALSLAYASIFVIFAQLGLMSYGAREVAKARNTQTRRILFLELWSVQIISSVLAFIMFNLLFLFILRVKLSALYFIQSFLIFINIFDISWFLVGVEEISKIIFRNLISRLFTTLAIFTLITHNHHLTLYALINVVGMLAGNLTMVYYSKKYIDYRKFTLKFKFKHFRGAFKLFVPTILISSYHPIENSILRFSASATSVGIYDQGIKIISLLFAVINSGFNALSPRMSYYVGNKKNDQVKELFNKTLTICSVFSIMVISGTIIVAEDFVAFFFGTGYDLVAPVLSLLSLSLVIMPIFTLINQGFLIPNDKDKEYTFSYVIMIISGIVFNLILSNRFGSMGAATAYNLGTLLSFLYIMYVTYLDLNVYLIFKNILLIILNVAVNIIIVTTISSFISLNSSFFSFLVNGSLSVMLNIFQIYISFFAKRKVTGIV